MKISKLLPITLALMLGMTGAFAATEATNSNAQANYQLELPEFFDVEVTAPAAASSAEYADNYTSINIATAIEGSFQVISNTNEKKVYLFATCPTSDGEKPALYGAIDAPKIIFANTATDGDGTKTSSAVIGAIRGGATTPEQSPNAIVFGLTVTPTMAANSHPSTVPTVAKAFSGTNNLEYTIPNSVTTFACSVSGSALDNSFSTLDTNGLYQATLYMSDTPQSL